MMYRWIMAAHVTADLCFVAGLLATWGLLAVRATASDPAFERRAQAMGHVTLKVAANGGIVAATATGATLVFLNPVLLQMPWLWAKLALVGVLFGLHGTAAVRHRKLGAAERADAYPFDWRAGVGTAVAAAGVFVAVLVRPFG